MERLFGQSLGMLIKTPRNGMLFAFIFALTSLPLAGARAERPAPTKSTPKKSLAAEVNGAAITTERLKREADFRLRGEAEHLDDKQRHEVERQILNELVERELLYQAAAQKKLLPSEDEFRKVVAEVRSGFGSDAQFRGKLAESNLDEKEFLSGLREDLAVKRYLDEEIYADVRVSDADVQEYLRAHPEPEEIQARQIFFRLKPDAAAEEKVKVRAVAEGVLAELQQDRSKFVALAKQYSDGPSRAKGGDLGFFTQNQLPADFSAAAFRLQPGQLSDLVETSEGFHIILVERRRGGASEPSPDAEKQIKERLVQEKRSIAIAAKLNELRKSGKVIVYFD
ncbi:MAG: peptidylprolyl isomerase [Bdellovibrionota bacterium]